MHCFRKRRRSINCHKALLLYVNSWNRGFRTVFAVSHVDRVSPLANLLTIRAGIHVYLFSHTYVRIFNDVSHCRSCTKKTSQKRVLAAGQQEDT